VVVAQVDLIMLLFIILQEQLQMVEEQGVLIPLELQELPTQVVVEVVVDYLQMALKFLQVEMVALV